MKYHALLAGLRISKDGQDLIDTKTGAIVNAFGATRFDVAVHALRGDFDPPKQVDVGMLWGQAQMLSAPLVWH